MINYRKKEDKFEPEREKDEGKNRKDMEGEKRKQLLKPRIIARESINLVGGSNISKGVQAKINNKIGRIGRKECKGNLIDEILQSENDDDGRWTPSPWDQKKEVSFDISNCLP